MTRSAAALLAATLDAHGVDLIYCVPGESYLAVTDALIDLPHIRLIVCRHESGALGRHPRESGDPGVTDAMSALVAPGCPLSRA